MASPDLLVLVPAWNEEEALPSVLQELALIELAHSVLVVDDGSTDGTTQVAKAFGARVLTLPINLGVGGAMRAGYRWALRNGYTCVVQVDADGQHNPSDIVRVVAPVLEGELDVSIGARFAGVGEYDQSVVRRATMWVLSTTISWVVGTRLTDTTSGFKAASLRAMKVYAQDFPMEYLGDTVEALIIGHKAGLKIGQVPVGMRQRRGGVASHNPGRAAVFLVRALLAMTVAITRPATRAIES